MGQVTLAKSDYFRNESVYFTVASLTRLFVGNEKTPPTSENIQYLPISGRYDSGFL